MKRILMLSLFSLLLCGAVLYGRSEKASAASRGTGADRNGICADALAPNQGADAKTDDGETVKTKDTGYYVKRIIGAAVVGLIIALITVAIMKSGMNNVTKARSAENYIVKDSFKVTKSNDRYISTKVTREKKTN